MELIKVQSNYTEESSKLLFYDNFKYEKPQYNIEEIFICKPIILHQIRILKSESNPHPKIKSMQSITQSEPIFNFEIFVRNLELPLSKFEQVLEPITVNEQKGNNDSIFPFVERIVTNHIILRGSFEKMTLCVYGQPLEVQESLMLLEIAKNDVQLDKLEKYFCFILAVRNSMNVLIMISRSRSTRNALNWLSLIL